VEAKCCASQGRALALAASYSLYYDKNSSQLTSTQNLGLWKAIALQNFMWNSSLPLVTAVLITPKGAESPGSHHIGVIGALVLILPSETV